MPFEVTCTAWKALFQEKENKKKEELAILERKNKKKEKKEMKQDIAGKSNMEKTSDKGEMCCNCNKKVKLTDVACPLCKNFSIRKVFHIIIKCTYLKTMKKIPKSATFSVC